MKKVLIALTLVAVLAGGGYLGGAYYLDNVYPALQSSPLKKDVEVEIKRGTSFTKIIDALSTKKLIEGKFLFYLYCYRNGWQDKFKSGNYVFEPGISRKDLVLKLLNGSVRQYKFTVIEGMTIKEIATLLGGKMALKPEKFMKLCKQGELFPYRNAKGDLEGYLYPDTYYFDAGTDEKELVSKMVGNFSAKLEKLRKELKLNEIRHLDQIVTMASIIEKESGNNEEKQLVASVFYNRLKQGILLQTDPTVIYAINRERDFNGNLTRNDLKMDSAYNTYRYPGLPPTPIGNPGIDSIRAALNPAKTDYLYFVSMQNGRHYFSKSLREHNNAVRKYQLKR